jgi:hypothetical protein
VCSCCRRAVPDFEDQTRPFQAAQWEVSQPMPMGGF